MFQPMLHPAITGNTLLSPLSIERILSLPRQHDVYTELLEIIRKFQDIRKFASEIHTEIHLVKPILKNLGYAYESKPKFFEEQVKGPDVALFATEEERERSSGLWGTREYYANTLGILLLKRYGRNLKEGIGGFFLEFENRIPLYQASYLLKTSRSPWAILTNGRRWILIKRPSSFEMRSIEIDIESALSNEDDQTLHLFYYTFSLAGVKQIVPHLLGDEKEALIDILKREKAGLAKQTRDLKKKVEAYPRIVDTYHRFVPEGRVPSTSAYLRERDVAISAKRYVRPNVINDYDLPEIFAYLFQKQAATDLVIPGGIPRGIKDKAPTKEDLLTMKILDMSPGFGATTVQMLEAIAYSSFLLPYKERNSFVAEWEEESTLKTYIMDNVLYGIERSHVAFDVLQAVLAGLSESVAPNYRLGNPLIGMSLRDISGALDIKKQMGLFGKQPGEVIEDFRETYRLYVSLSERIKEDVQKRNELQAKLDTCRERIRDLLDILTASYFSGSRDLKRFHEVFFHLDGDATAWTSLRKTEWFGAAKTLARRNGFFHLEIEFPFLLSDAFDLVLARPFLSYLWEDDPPRIEAMKTYIKRGMTCLKPDGRMLLLVAEPVDDLLAELKKSRKYEAEKEEGLLVLRKRST